MKTYPANIVASITTERLLCKFAEMHECIEYLLNRQVWTHELADFELVMRLKNGVWKQHPTLREINYDGINKNNWEEYKYKINADYGDLELKPFE